MPRADETASGVSAATARRPTRSETASAATARRPAAENPSACRRGRSPAPRPASKLLAAAHRPVLVVCRNYNFLLLVRLPVGSYASSVTQAVQRMPRYRFIGLEIGVGGDMTIQHDGGAAPLVCRASGQITSNAPPPNPKDRARTTLKRRRRKNPSTKARGANVPRRPRRDGISEGFAKPSSRQARRAPRRRRREYYVFLGRGTAASIGGMGGCAAARSAGT